MRRKDPRLSDATNSRRRSYKYYYIDDNKRFAVAAGRCFKCGKVNDAFCDSCNQWLCKNHLVETDKDGGCLCVKCSEAKVYI